MPTLAFCRCKTQGCHYTHFYELISFLNADFSVHSTSYTACTTPNCNTLNCPFLHNQDINCLSVLQQFFAMFFECTPGHVTQQNLQRWLTEFGIENLNPIDFASITEIDHDMERFFQKNMIIIYSSIIFNTKNNIFIFN